MLNAFVEWWRDRQHDEEEWKQWTDWVFTPPLAVLTAAPSEEAVAPVRRRNSSFLSFKAGVESIEAG